MEETGVMSEEAWSWLSGMYTGKEDSDFLPHFLSGFSSSNDLSEIQPSDKTHSSLVCSPDFCNSNEGSVSPATSILSPDDGQSVMCLDGSYFHAGGVCEGYERHRCTSRTFAFGDYEMGLFEPVFYFPAAGEPLLKSYNLEGISDQYDISDIRKLEKQELDIDQPRQRDLANVNAPESKKRSRNNVTDAARSKRNLKSDKYQKFVSENATRKDESITVITKKSSDSHSSEEHSSITHEVTEGETHISKTSKATGGYGKSGKGASSDPQSLYARKRRERINERLRILQGLVPNGTKVDISTMLEEAVHYVKFLQLQIKLLSSDDTWMYAPLAYNGMDIGISNLDITTSNTSPS